MVARKRPLQKCYTFSLADIAALVKIAVRREPWGWTDEKRIETARRFLVSMEKKLTHKTFDVTIPQVLFLLDLSGEPHWKYQTVEFTSPI